MRREFNYIENYKGVKIYQYNDNKNYTAIVRTKSFERKDLKDLKAKIDEGSQSKRWRKVSVLDMFK